MPSLAKRTAWLECRQCGRQFGLLAMFEGCPDCAAGMMSPLEVNYDYDAFDGDALIAEWKERPPGLWSYHEFLPLADPRQAVTLCEGRTPLVRLDVPGPGRIWLKDESRNPTGAHKDRFHSVSVSMARTLGLKKITAATTGNHGVSAAAYAARAGLSSLIFCDPEAPDVLQDLIQLYGGRVVLLRDRQAFLARLVRDFGWYPSTGLTPMPVGTPYGVEGYKSIAYEIYFQLGAKLPARVIVPVASGDVLYGPWKGFRELARLTGAADAALPRMVVAQSSGCDPIVTGFRAGEHQVPVHPNPQTVARSIGDATAAPITLSTLYESKGGAEAVSDADILATVTLLARRAGIAAEPSAAAAVAAALQMQARGEIGDDEDVVCIVTGGAAKWPDTIKRSVEPHLIAESDKAALEGWIIAADRDIGAASAKTA